MASSRFYAEEVFININNSTISYPVKRLYLYSTINQIVFSMQEEVFGVSAAAIRDVSLRYQ